MSSNTEDHMKRFYKLFERYDFFCNTFYIMLNTNICKLIMCIHSKTGYRILVDIPEELEIVFDKRASTKNNIVTIEEVSCDLDNTNVDELYIAKKYKNDDLQHPLDINNEHMDSLLLEEYKYNINVTKTKTFLYNLKDVVNQLNRLKHTISLITHYGLAIESQNILGLTKLNSNNEICTYKINKATKNTRLLYTLFSLEFFYDKRKMVDEMAITIHEGVMDVLNRTFNKQFGLLKSLTTKHDNSLDQVHYIYETQQSYKKYFDSLKPVFNSEDVVERVKLLDKIDCIALCIDKIMFDNIIAYNTIANNYELLIKMEKFFK